MMAKYLSPVDAWAIAFGCIVGWGAFVMPGTTFIPMSGPGGAVLSMVLSTAIILVIGRNFAFLMQRRPGTGGVYSYTKEAFGRDHAFLCSWFLSLSYLTIVFLNATALFVMSRTVFGDFWQVGFHYQVVGYDIYFGELALSATVLVVVGLLFVLGKPLLQRLQAVFAIVLFAGILLIALVAIPHLDIAQLADFTGEEEVSIVGAILTLVLLAPWAFVGFEVTSLETAHFKFPVKKSWRVVALSVLCGGLAYILMTIVSVTYLPQGASSWPDYIMNLEHMSGVASVPTFYAMRSALGTPGMVIISITALAAILTGIIGASRATVRMLSTMAEDQILSSKFLNTTFCVVFITLISILISFLGRNALNWFVELTSFGATIGFGYTSAAAAKLAKKEGNNAIRVTGIVGLTVSAAFAIVHLASKISTVETMSAPSFLLLGLWCLVGFLFYWRTMRKSMLSEFSGASLSGGILFGLLFYSVLMWSTKTSLGAVGTEQMEFVLIRNTVVLLAFVAIGLVGMLYIQSALRKRHEELERDKVRAQESSKAKSQFLFNMSHDIRTPMNAIIGYTTLAQHEKDVSPKMGEYLRKIEVSGKQLLALIDDILEMSRIESGKMELEPVPMDLRLLLEDTESMFAVQMQTKNIAFSVDATQLHDRYVVCDGNRLSRVLQNLLSNAYKFTPEGGTVSVVARQLASVAPGTASFELRVKDTGIGMKPEFVERVFDAFERERTSTVSGIQGTGLGMAITKSIVELMGGSIEVASEVGRGSEFTVHLAFDVASEQDVHVAAHDASVQTGADYSSTRLLLVEDNAINREIMTMMLSEYGFAVETAVNGREAVEAVAEAQPGYYDAVLMDIQMPVMDGYEATRKIRGFANAQQAQVPIIAVTANAFGEDVRKALEVGMNGHVAKPVDPDKLIEVLGETLEDEPAGGPLQR